MATPVTLYTSRFCSYCIRAKQLLQQKGTDFEELTIDGDPQMRSQMMELSGRHTVPQIWIGERHVGGFDDLWFLEQRGQLDEMLSPI